MDRAGKGRNFKSRREDMNITVDRAVIEQTLEALENLPALSWIPEQEKTVFEAITALRTALKQANEKPIKFDTHLIDIWKDKND